MKEGTMKAETKRRDHNKTRQIPAKPPAPLPIGDEARTTPVIDPQRQLLDLLALIHRDGGKHYQKHGIATASAEAEKIVVRTLCERTEAIKRNAELEELLANARNDNRENQLAAKGVVADLKAKLDDAKQEREEARECIPRPYCPECECEIRAVDEDGLCSSCGTQPIELDASHAATVAELVKAGRAVAWLFKGAAMTLNLDQPGDARLRIDTEIKKSAGDAFIAALEKHDANEAKQQTMFECVKDDTGQSEKTLKRIARLEADLAEAHLLLGKHAHSEHRLAQSQRGNQRLSDKNAQLRRMLRLAEWNGYDTDAGERCCPCCNAWAYRHGKDKPEHSESCGLEAALKVGE